MNDNRKRCKLRLTDHMAKIALINNMFLDALTYLKVRNLQNYKHIYRKTVYILVDFELIKHVHGQQVLICSLYDDYFGQYIEPDDAHIVFNVLKNMVDQLLIKG